MLGCYVIFIVFLGYVGYVVCFIGKDVSSGRGIWGISFCGRRFWVVVFLEVGF